MRQQRSAEGGQSSLAKGLCLRLALAKGLGRPQLFAKGVGLVVAVALLDGTGLSPDRARAATPLLVSAANATDPQPTPSAQPSSSLPRSSSPAPSSSLPRSASPPGSTSPAPSAKTPRALPLASHPLVSFARTQPLAVATGALLLVLLIADRLVLWKRPRWLLRLPDEGVLLPIGEGNGFPLGARLFRLLKYRQRVLEAWVADHRATIEARFNALATVEQRRHHLSLPVRVGQLLEPDFTPARLKGLAGGTGGLLLISGEGGVGKTSLALEIARAALAADLTGQTVVPVLVEADLRGEETFLSKVRSALADLTEHRGGEPAAPEPTLPLVEALLRRRRLLVILDHYSELGDESRQRLDPSSATFPSGWVIVTSRKEESFGGKGVLHLRPQRLTAVKLMPFFDAYLTRVKQAEDWDDDLLERAAGRLREITAGLRDERQAITVLLAKLYIDVVLTERRGAGGGVLPASVPALMLTYIRQINAAIEEEQRQPRELVVRALQHLARSSEEPLFRPRSVPLEQALQALTTALAERHGTGGAEGHGGLRRDAVALLRYLVERLLLVEEASDGQSLRLVLDPLADYLAALWWLRQLESADAADAADAAAWAEFLDHTLPPAGSESATLARGFLRALYDSAVHAADPAVLALEVAPERVARLAERAAIDPERIAREQERRRLRRLVDDLAEPDLAVRLQAIEELCRRRSGEPLVSEALGRVLASTEQDGQAREAAAVALAVLGGEAAARALSGVAAAAAAPAALRRTALEGLGLVVARWRGDRGGEGGAAGQAAGRHRWLRELERALRADAIDRCVAGEEGWAELDARLGVLQGASRGLQLAAAADLPLLGGGPGRLVPMLTLTARKEGEGLRVRTEVVEVPVWSLPLPELPGGERPRLELVVVPAGEYPIGSTEAEPGREEMMDWYAANRIGCEGVDVEARRTVRLQPLALARHPITRAQWRSVAQLPRLERDLNSSPGTRKPDGLWETHAQPGALPVDSVSWHDAQEWLRRLNAWLEHQWPEWTKTWPSQAAGASGPPRLALPSESQWEAACRAGASTPFHFGDTLDANWANFDGGYVYGPGRRGVYRQGTVPVGFFGLVNRWGLAEMHGQLYEWCADQWHPDPAAQGWPSDGTAWEGVDPTLEATGTAQKDWKLLRGGSWILNPLLCRAAIRYGGHPALVSPFVGLRPCCLLPPGFLLGP